MIKKKFVIIIAAASLVVVSGAALGLCYGLRDSTAALSPYVEVYETTGTKSKLQARQSDIAWKDYEFSGNTEVNVDSDVIKNTFHGAGVAITHSSAYVLQTMSEARRVQALETLFGATGGRLNVVRIPIGTSDYTYTTSFYTLDDMPSGQDDFDLEHFSIANDQEYLIPTLQEIKAINPDVHFIAAPWSAPAWMKNNDSLIGGNIIGHGGSVATEEEGAYANYLVQFVESYNAQGIYVEYLSLVNEPTIANVDYPSMQMGTSQYVRIGLMVGAKLRAQDLSTRIMAYDHNVGSDSDRVLFDLFADEIEDNSALRSYVSGFAFHGYGADWSSIYPNLLSDNDEFYPEMENYVTEITESADSVDFAANLSWSTANVTIGPLSYGASMSVYWNAALTSGGEPVLGNDAVCFGMLSIDGDDVKKAAAYYSFTHVTRFAYPVDGVEPVQVDSLSDNEAKIKSVAYRRGDGAYVFVIANNDATTYEDVDIVMQNRSFTYRIQPESVATFLALPKSEHYSPVESIGFTKVDIVQKTLDRYEVNATLDKEYSDVGFHLGTSDIYAESQIVESSPITSTSYGLSLSSDPGDMYLWAKAGELSGVLPLTIPRMTPSLLIDEGIATINFGLDITTSWSSFCDPYGKAIYRSATPLFDASAEQVNVTESGVVDPIYILTETYSDEHYEASKPYYFLVMAGKNGLSKFVSYPLATDSTLFVNPAMSISNVSGVARLNVTATISGNVSSSDLTLAIKEISGERHEVASESESGLLFTFDCSQMSKAGTWYDLTIVNELTGAEYDLPATAMSRNNITIGLRRYGFKEWSGLAKIAFDNLNYANASADIILEATTPVLKVEGTMADSSSAELMIAYWDGSASITLATCANMASISGRFAFAFDLTSLITSGTYYDIVLAVDGIPSDMTSDMAINIARSLDFEGRQYAFRTWEGLLKVTFN